MAFFPRLLLFSLLCYAWSSSDASKSPCVLACFAVVAGRKATADGSVLVAHNEQDLSPCLISFDRVPRLPFDEAVPKDLRSPRRLVLPSQTAAFLWSQCLLKNAGDSCLNEYGVAVVSNKCPTREDPAEVLAARGDLVGGGIGYLLRRLVAQQATTAREGVTIAGELVEGLGYTPPGRTYVIADPNEAWLLAVVGGRRWVAQRVPDDAVAVLPNVHIIRRVDLADTAHFLGSADLVDYAVRRGWYDPAIDGPFDFRKVYREEKPVEDATADDTDSNSNSSARPNLKIASPDDSSAGQQRTDPPDPRRWWAYRLVTGRDTAWPPEQPLPLWIRPREPMSVASMIEILRSRGGQKPISADTTVEAAVLQLRASLPRAIGCVYWRVTCEPSSGVLTPWYLGVSKVPESYHEPANLARRLTLDYHFNPPAETFQPRPELAWWKFKTLQDRVHEDYDGRIGVVRGVWDVMEKRLMAQQEVTEQAAMRLWQDDRAAASDYLAECCAKAASEACREADRLVAVLERKNGQSQPRPHLARPRQTAQG